MATRAEEVQQLYIAYLGRAADKAGLDYWTTGEGAGLDLAQLRANFVNEQPEYEAVYGGLSREETLVKIYENLFERAPDAAGLNYWLNEEGAVVAIDDLLVAFLNGASAADQAIVDNKVVVAQAYSAAAGTNYDQDAARAIVDGITDQASVDAALAQIELQYPQQPEPGTPGESKLLTVGVDTIIGTADDDVFTAQPVNPVDSSAANTLSAFDSIDGGAGNDTLNIYTTDTHHRDLPAFATVKNIETINIFNSGNAGAFGDASKYEGVKALNQIGEDADAVTNLKDGTVAGFRGTDDNISVSAAAAASSASIALTDVADENTISVSGDALSSVKITGNLVDADEDGDVYTSLQVGAGKDVQALTITTAVNASLSVFEHADSAKEITSVDASTSTGSISFSGDTDVATIKTGSGDDYVELATVTAKAAGGAPAVNASVSTGAGDDDIYVITSGTGDTTVDSGAGDDVIDASDITATGALTINAGAGNDVVVLGGAALATNDVIDGGDGVDTIGLAGVATRTDDDFIVLNNLLKNFETLAFTSSEGLTSALDASKLAAGYTTLSFDEASAVKNVGSQALVAYGDLEATAAGYKAADGGTPATYAGALNITASGNSEIAVGAESVALTVDASELAADIDLLGDVKSASVTLVRGVNDSSTPANPADDFLNNAWLNVSTDGNLRALTSLTVSGNGSVFVENVAGSSLVTVDASALNAADIEGEADGGLSYVSTNAAAETIKLGGGIDSITLGASTYGAVDTIHGLNLVLAEDGESLADESDLIDVGEYGFAKFTTTQSTLDLALKDAAVFQVNNAAADKLVFNFGGDTYIYVDKGTADLVDAADTLVKLVGTVDLDTLLVALEGGL